VARWAEILPVSSQRVESAHPADVTKSAWVAMGLSGLLGGCDHSNGYRVPGSHKQAAIVRTRMAPST